MTIEMLEQMARTIERNVCRIQGCKAKSKRLFGKQRYGESKVENDLKKYDHGQGVSTSGREKQKFSVVKNFLNF
jgi:hypothetical protein